ncbi:hypothetical protein LXL04_036471 [Taraxacum kok-saghyz]
MKSAIDVNGIGFNLFKLVNKCEEDEGCCNILPAAAEECRESKRLQSADHICKALRKKRWSERLHSNNEIYLSNLYLTRQQRSTRQPANINLLRPGLDQLRRPGIVRSSSPIHPNHIALDNTAEAGLRFESHQQPASAVLSKAIGWVYWAARPYDVGPSELVQPGAVRSQVRVSPTTCLRGIVQGYRLGCIGLLDLTMPGLRSWSNPGQKNIYVGIVGSQSRLIKQDVSTMAQLWHHDGSFPIPENGEGYAAHDNPQTINRFVIAHSTS